MYYLRVTATCCYAKVIWKRWKLIETAATSPNRPFLTLQVPMYIQAFKTVSPGPGTVHLHGHDFDVKGRSLYSFGTKY